MSIKLLAAVAAILAPLVLAGCGAPSQEIGEQAAEKLMEKALESSGGGDVDVKAENGQIAIKSEDGQTKFSAGADVELPDGFPASLILADDAKIIIASTAGNGYSVAYVTNETQAQMFTQYKNDLVADDWKKTLEMDTEEAKMINFSKDKINLSVTIGENNNQELAGKTMISLIYSETLE